MTAGKGGSPSGQSASSAAVSVEVAHLRAAPGVLKAASMGRGGKDVGKIVDG